MNSTSLSVYPGSQSVHGPVSHPSYDPLVEKVRLESVVQWVTAYLSSRCCKITANGDAVVSGVLLPISEVLRDMKLQYDLEYKTANRQLDREDRVDPATGKTIEDALQKLISEEWRDQLSLKNHGIKCHSFEDLGHATRFIKACTGKESKLDTHVLAHWMWQVKRKMQGLPVSNHIMLVFTGKQGAGKSSAIDILTKQLIDYRTDMAITQFADERNYHSLEKTFVVISDEMQGCNKTDIEYLKHIVTAQSISARKLYTNSRDKILQNASFIGSSNKPIDLIIRDETGMRRFFGIDCAERMDWEELNQIDPLEIWRSIDELRPVGYLCEVLDELRLCQENYRFKDSVEYYLEEARGLEGERDKRVVIRDLFSDYVEWCKESQNRPFDKSYFSKRLKALGLASWRTKSSRGMLLGSSFVYWKDQVVEADLDQLEERIDSAKEVI